MILNTLINKPYITDLLKNIVIHSVSENLTDQPNITSHSFQVGYIYQL